MSADTTASVTEPTPGLLLAANLVYGLHSLSILIGVTSAATVIGAFVFSFPSIVAVIINYVKRGEARGTFLESHFRWQIRTFWFAAMWALITALLIVTIIGIVVAWIVAIGAGLWVIYRIVRGWLALSNREPVSPMV